MEKLIKIKLTEDQKEIVEHEFRMKLILEPNFKKQLSKKLWNELKSAVYITYKDGELVKAETDPKPRIW
tara:strand:+ start:399 stop:605 length:207 start_codon:yes stop_codon:yes gene_type:complete